MKEELLIALLQFATRFGIAATIEFLRNRGVTIDDAIAALGKAETKSIADYLREDLARRNLPPVP